VSSRKLAVEGWKMFRKDNFFLTQKIQRGHK
jgi:hypothetical protein